MYRLKPFFEIAEVAGEYVCVPVGEQSETFGGIVTLSETAAFLLNNMKKHQSINDLSHALVQEYNIGESIALDEVNKAIKLFNDLGLIEQ